MRTSQSTVAGKIPTIYQFAALGLDSNGESVNHFDQPNLTKELKGNHLVLNADGSLTPVHLTNTTESTSASSSRDLIVSTSLQPPKRSLKKPKLNSAESTYREALSKAFNEPLLPIGASSK